MTFNLTAIFGTELGDVIAPVVVDVPADDPLPDVPDDPAEQLPGDFGNAALTSWPIIEGTEHFSLWVDDPAGDWPEFIPGQHHDIRQPNRLRGLCSPALVQFEAERQRIIDEGAPEVPW